MDLDLLRWALTLKIIACSFHCVAIACTLFRLFYRWCMAHFWWEDGWAAFALVADVLCLISAWLDVPEADHGREDSPLDEAADWVTALGLPCVLWACRISILLSIIRVANPSKGLRRIAFLVGSSFVVMWMALTGQKAGLCIKNGCKTAVSVGVSQLITDAASDSVLVVLPIYFLRRTSITRRQRILIYSVFSVSLLVTAVTILHSVLVFMVRSSGLIVISHVKTALSLIVCNLLVIVAFVYRMCRCVDGSDLDAPDEAFSLTDVDLDMCITESETEKPPAAGVEVPAALEGPRSRDLSGVEGPMGYNR